MFYLFTSHYPSIADKLKGGGIVWIKVFQETQELENVLDHIEMMLEEVDSPYSHTDFCITRNSEIKGGGK